MYYAKLPQTLFSCCALALAVVMTTALAGNAHAQSPGGPLFQVGGPSQRLEMVINTSRILTLDKKIPRIQVNNPELVKAQPLSPYKVQLAATRPGVTQINLWDEDNQVHTVDVLILGDARELQMLLDSEFPNSALKVRPLASSVVISGFVDRPENVSRIVRMAEDYYPKIINNITVGGVQQVLLHVKVIEVSRTKMREMGFDWASFTGNDFVSSRGAGILAPPEVNVAGGVTGSLSASTDTIRFGLVSGGDAFFGFLDALRSYNLAKLLSEPTLTTVSGRPASFNVGGEFPILVPGGLGTVSIEYKQFGTRVDFVPIVLGNGNIRLEVRPSVTERDDASGVNGVPAIRTRWIDTAAEMKAGQTLALAGLIQRQTEATNSGVPLVSDLPWIGAAFRHVEHRVNETELLIMVTPELIAPLDRCQVPHCLPGSFTTDPSDKELYGNGYLEVPKCCDGACLSCDGGFGYGGKGGQHGCSCGGGKAAYGQPIYSAPPQGGQIEYSPTPAASSQYQPQRIPAINTSTRVNNQQNQRYPNRRSQEPTRPAANSQPGLIGPLGYDVLK